LTAFCKISNSVNLTYYTYLPCNILIIFSKIFRLNLFLNEREKNLLHREKERERKRREKKRKREKEKEKPNVCDILIFIIIIIIKISAFYVKIN